jgi:hypothetical protein
MKIFKLSFSIFILALAAAFCMTVSSPRAYAGGFTSVGAATYFGSDLSQEWNEQCPLCANDGGSDNNFTSIELFIEPSGSNPSNLSFTDPGSVDGGWTATLVNSQYLLLSGPSSSNINFSTDLLDPVTTAVIDMYSLDGSILVDSAQLQWPGSGPYGWNVVSPLTADNLADENTAATPEPSSLMLLGTGLVGGSGLLYRRRNKGTSSLITAV